MLQQRYEKTMYIGAQKDRASYIPGGIFILMMFTAFERARVSHIEKKFYCTLKCLSCGVHCFMNGYLTLTF